MALDRVVRFPGKFPTDEELDKVLKNYMGGVGKIEKSEEMDGHYRYIVTVPGKPTSPFESVKGAANVPLRDERWFEVTSLDPDDLYIDVITREQDEFTNNIAQGFAELLVRFWGGKLEQ